MLPNVGARFPRPVDCVDCVGRGNPAPTVLFIFKIKCKWLGINWEAIILVFEKRDEIF